MIYRLRIYLKFASLFLDMPPLLRTLHLDWKRNRDVISYPLGRVVVIFIKSRRDPGFQPCLIVFIP